MAAYYADSSVLVKRHVAEIGSTWVENLCDPSQGHEVATSRLSAVEVVSALNRRVRDDFLAFCRGSYRLLQATNPVLARARLMLERHALRSYDALHLATALVTEIGRKAHEL